MTARPTDAATLDELTVARLVATSWWGPRDVLADCADCGNPYWRHVATSRYCSDACRSLAHNRRVRARPERRAGPRRIRLDRRRTAVQEGRLPFRPRTSPNTDRERWYWEQWRR